MDERREIRRTIECLLKMRGPGKTICPSEAARAVYEPEHWRSKMPLVRELTLDMTKSGIVDIYQQGKRVDLEELRGPIRIRKKQRP